MKKTNLIVKICIIVMAITISMLSAGCDTGVDSVDFSYSQDVKDPRLFYFTANGDSDFGDFKYSWNFGNGDIKEGKDVNNTFLSFGRHIVSMTAEIKESDISKTVTKDIVIDVPKIDNLNINFERDSKNIFKGIFTASCDTNYEVSYKWDLGDGMTRTGSVQDIDYITFGKKSIRLTASIPELDYSVSKEQVIDFDAPKINNLHFIYKIDKLNPYKAIFTAESNSDLGDIQYEWDFGEGIAATGNKVSHTFPYADNHIVSIKASILGSDIYNISTKEVSIVDKSSVYIDYDYHSNRDDKLLLTKFVPIINSDFINIKGYRWDFGDHSYSTDEQPEHQYKKSGAYTVELSVNRAEGEPLKATKNVYVLEDVYFNEWGEYFYDQSKCNMGGVAGQRTVSFNMRSNTLEAYKDILDKVIVEAHIEFAGQVSHGILNNGQYPYINSKHYYGGKIVKGVATITFTLKDIDGKPTNIKKEYKKNIDYKISDC